MVHFESTVYKETGTGRIGCTVICLDEEGEKIGDIHISNEDEWRSIKTDIERLKLSKVDETYMIQYVAHVLTDYVRKDELEDVYAKKTDLLLKEDKSNKTDSFEELTVDKYPNLIFFKEQLDDKENLLIFTGEEQNIKTINGEVIRGKGDIPFPPGVIVEDTLDS